MAARAVDEEALGALLGAVKEHSRPLDRIGIYRPSRDEELRELFDELDTDSSGTLSKCAIDAPCTQCLRHGDPIHAHK
eukprot:COSAG01_NODE_286_length_19421_cov_123.895663_25_plen_78_part_00